MSDQDEMEEEARPEREMEGVSPTDARIMAILPARRSIRGEENIEDKIREGSSRVETEGKSKRDNRMGGVYRKPRKSSRSI